MVGVCEGEAKDMYGGASAVARKNGGDDALMAACTMGCEACTMGGGEDAQ